MTAPSPPRDGLRRRRQAARAVLTFERAWPAIWPALGMLGGFVCAALLGVPQRLPPLLHLALLAGVAAVVAALAWRGLRGLRWPDEQAADRRLERDSGLSHRPLAALVDNRAEGSGDAAVWEAHLARLAGLVGRLRLRPPRPGLAARDRRAWRALLLLGLACGLGIAGADAPQRLLTAVRPVFPPAVPPAATRLQAWLTPPGFTGMAPILLTADHPDVSAPAGSRLTASLSGGGGSAPSLVLAGKASAFQPLESAEAGSGASGWQATAELSSGGTLSVRRDGADIARWELTAVADVPPTVQWPAPPQPTRGRQPQLRLPWQVAHLYGVAALQAELRLQARMDAPALVVPIPLAGAPRSARGAQLADLTAHPWAGLPVVATLAGRDTAGLVGRSAARGVTLPERRFLNPAARSLVAVRKLLALQPQEHGPPLAALQRLAGQDAVWQSDSGGYLNLREAMNRLARAPLQGAAATAAIDAVQARLWQLALHLEEGAPARTAQALAQARKALHEAMAAAQQRADAPPAHSPGDKAPDKPGEAARQPSAAEKAEIARREQALAQALQQYMQALRRQAQSDPRHPAPPEQQAIEAERALRQMQQATQSDQMNAAQDRLAELDQALDALEQARRDAEFEPGAASARRQASARPAADVGAGRPDPTAGRRAGPCAGPRRLGGRLGQPVGRAARPARPARIHRRPRAARRGGRAARRRPDAGCAAPGARRADAAIRRPDGQGAAQPG